MSADMFDLTGRVAIVTGGGTGIGAATARLLARHGADVVLASRSAEELERVAAEIRSTTGRHSLPVPTDVRDEEQVVRMVQRTVDEFGRIDILINNAGGTRLGPLTGITTKAWDTIFALNAKAPYFCTREAGRHMIARGSGAIVNVSSSSGLHGVRGGAHYASAKAALQMFTMVTANEWARHHIRANCVAVGLVASERAVEAWKVAKIDQEAAARSIPARRAGTPDEVANAIFFFVSDAASFISGQTLEVNGGPSMGGIPEV